MIHEFVELTSLGLTFPAMYVAISVLMFFLMPAYRVIWKAKVSRDWLIIGIVTGFAGSAGDNAFWFVAWSLDYLGNPSASDVFQLGVYFNIPLRQTALIVSGYAHVRAKIESEIETYLGTDVETTLSEVHRVSQLSAFHTKLIRWFVIGMIYASTLWLIKCCY